MLLMRCLGGVGVGIVAAVAVVGCSGRPDMTRAGLGTEAPGAPAEGTAGGGGAVQPAAPPVGPAAAPGSTVFAVQYGDEGQQSLGGSATDADGNVYVVGYESPEGIVTLSPTGQRVFGGPEGTANGTFVHKYDATGALRWRQPFPYATQSSSLLAVATQPTTGVVIVAGWVSGTLTIGETTLTSGTNPNINFPSRNLWLTAFDSAGYLLWTRIYTSPFDAFPEQVFVTGNGDVEVVGSSVDNATVGGGALCCRNSQFGLNTFIARYSPVGDHLWSTAVTGEFAFGGAGGDPAGGVAVGGSLVGTMMFDGQTLSGGSTSPGGGFFLRQGVVVRVDPTGHAAWIKAFEGTGGTNLGAALGPAGEVVVHGSFSGTLDLGNGNVLAASTSSPLQRDGFLAKLAPDGTALWGRSFASDGFNEVRPQRVAVDVAGNIATVGTTSGGRDVGGPPLLPVGTSGDFVAKFAGGGDLLWSRGFAVETSNSASGRFGVSFDPSGAISFSGEFDNTVDFGTGPLTAPGETSTGSSALPRVPDDVFVLRIAP